MKKVAIIGLGYVGLPLLCLSIEKGFSTIGFDIDEEKLVKIREKTLPFSDDLVEKFFKEYTSDITVTNDPSELEGSEIYILCVPTPVHDDFTPDLSPIKLASETVLKTLKKGQLVIVESTIYPGTIEEIVKPILEKSGLFTGKDFFLAHCPERIDPGNKTWTLRNIPRVCGAFSNEGLKLTEKFYTTILDSEIYPLSSLKAAEACKIVENSFRDINIAFVNELAMSFQIMGIDVVEIIKGASTKPFAFMPHFPGAGVGGHCIPVDPYYLIEKASDLGFEHKFLKLAREINNYMPKYTVSLLEELTRELNIDLRTKVIGLMGISFKRGIDDTRNSPHYTIKKILEEKKLKTISYDPYVLNQSSVVTLDSFLEKSDILILITGHQQFLDIEGSEFKQNEILGIIDGRNILDSEKIKRSGINYRGIGQS
ncbi:MAG: nucleotide sugar dehydrogenase [Candidatus Hodarchaeales archaeon]|jgi:nucleotide sugar dehydrogenase